jgi:predicted RNA-binding Zn-ribbon protein involved in translation (DUF1610 family)
MELLPFDRDTPCPACGIRMDIGRACREAHADLPARSGTSPLTGHLHVECPGCGWAGYMELAFPDGDAGSTGADGIESGRSAVDRT